MNSNEIKSFPNSESNESLVSISLKNNNDKEIRAKELLEGILKKYSLGKWIYTHEVLLEAGARPHAFPVITLGTYKDKEFMLRMFIHEQLHWIEKGKEDSMKRAIEDLKLLFPNAPTGRPEGADSEESTYRHLVICRLEFLAAKDLIGEDKARESVLGDKEYTWIHGAVLDNGSQIDLIIEKYFPNIL